MSRRNRQKRSRFNESLFMEEKQYAKPDYWGLGGINSFYHKGATSKDIEAVALEVFGAMYYKHEPTRM